MKQGLVLEGGGMRGLFVAGVIDELMENGLDSCFDGAIGFLLHRYPKVIDCLRHRHEVYNAELEYIKGEVEKGNTLLIAPSEDLNIGRIEMKPEKLKKVHQLGREACLRQLSKIKSFLHQTRNFF